MASILPTAKTQFLDANGRPLAGGKVFFYFVATETKKDTFQDPDLAIPNTNPVVLDSYGEASIWGTGSYRQVLTDKDGVQIWDQVTQEVGASLSGDSKEEVFVAGDGIADHTFVPGTTTTLTLTNSFGSVSNIDVHFDAAYQGPDQIGSLVGKTLTFASPIPVGVERVYVKGGIAVPMNAPADNTVTDASVATGSALDVRIEDGVFPDQMGFGILADSGKDATLAINMAYSVAKTARKKLCFLGGTYLTDTFYLGAPSYGQAVHMVGAGRIQTVLQKKTSDGLPVMQIGTPTMTQYVGPMVIEHIRFSGIAGDSVAAVRTYSLVRSTFRECVFENALDGCLNWGGISTVWQRCTFQNNKRGWVCDGDPTLYGGGYPNLLSLDDCLLIDNSQWGGYADRCRGIYVRGRDIEGNGTSGAPGNQGGFCVGPNVNAEGGDAPATSIALAVCFEGVWLEANVGTTAILQLSGFCSYRDVICVANTTTYDLQIEGGRYALDGFDCGSAKTYNLFEDALPGVAYGNVVLNSRIPGSIYDANKTMFHDTWHNAILMRNGSVPVTNDFIAPYMQTGEATVNGTANVTFPVPFKAGTVPRMFTGFQSNSSGTMEQAEFYNVTNTGFSVRVKSLTSGSSAIGTANRTVDWMAVGTTM